MHLNAFILPAFALLLSSATVPNDHPSDRSTPSGTYGVCGCASDAVHDPPIALTVNDDGSFHYVNATDPAHPIDATGQWRQEGRKLVLISAAGDEQKWSMDKDQPCVRTRTGLLFTRLCKLKECR